MTMNSNGIQRGRRRTDDRALSVAERCIVELQRESRRRSLDRERAADGVFASLQERRAVVVRKIGGNELAQRVADQRRREAQPKAEEATEEATEKELEKALKKALEDLAEEASEEGSEESFEDATEHDADDKANVGPVEKRDGKRNGRAVLPSGVTEGRIRRQLLPAQRLDPVGLYNASSLCYRNALLQCLIHTPEFYHMLGNLHQDCPKEAEECITCALQAVVSAYWDHQFQRNILRQARYDLNLALKAVFPKDEDIQDELQSDPHEALQMLIRRIVEDSSGVDPNFDEEPRVGMNNFTVTSLFFVELESKWECVTCGKVHKGVSPPSFGLSITLLEGNQGTIEAQLTQLYSSPLYQKSPFVCDSLACQHLRQIAGFKVPEQTVHREITHAPAILVVQLARNNFGTKLTQRIPYQQQLDLSMFAATRGEDILYELNGVVSHSGPERYSGHYVASVLRQNPVDSFSLINDAEVSAPTRDNNTLLNPGIGEVYMLFYSRI